MSTKLELAEKLVVEKKEDVTTATTLVADAKAALEKADEAGKAAANDNLIAAEAELKKASDELAEAEGDHQKEVDAKAKRAEKAAGKKAAGESSDDSEAEKEAEAKKSPYRVGKGKSLGMGQKGNLTEGAEVSADMFCGGGEAGQKRLDELVKEELVVDTRKK